MFPRHKAHFSRHLAKVLRTFARTSPTKEIDPRIPRAVKFCVAEGPYAVPERWGPGTFHGHNGHGWPPSAGLDATLSSPTPTSQLC